MDVEDQLRHLLEAGDGAACAAWLEERTPEERRALAPVVRAHPVDPGPYGVRVAAHVLAMAACFDGEELARRRWPLPFYIDGLVPLLVALRPPWLEAWVAHALATHIHSFRVALPLAEAGAIAWPEHPDWIQGLVAHGVLYPGGPAALLRAHPRLLAQVPRLFEVEGAGEGCLAAADKYVPDDLGWSASLRGLMAAGALARDDLLRWSLEALGRGFSPFRAGWFSRFHEALEPTDAERAASQARYRTLLASDVGPTVALALKALQRVARGGTLEVGPTLEALTPAVQAKAKGTARGALKLAAAVAGDAERGALTGLAAAALAHPAREVQADALAILEEHAQPGDRVVAAHAGRAAAGVAPTLRARLEPWVRGELPAPELAAEAGAALPEADVDSVRPLRDEAELVARLRGWLGSPGDALEVERILEGCGRLGGAPPRDAELAKDAAKALAQELEPRSGEYPDMARAWMAVLACRWATGETPAGPAESPRPRVHAGRYDKLPEHGAMLARRIQAVLAQVEEGVALPVLAAPTHRPAWVAAGTLVERLRAWEEAGREPPALEVGQALLRLAAGGRVGAAREARGLRSEAGRALRYALGENLDVGADPRLWVAAGQARTPGRPPAEVAARHPGLGPGVDAPAEYRVTVDVREQRDWTHRTLRIQVRPEVPLECDPEVLPVWVHSSGGTLNRWSDRRVAGFSPEAVRRAALVTPADPEWFFAEGARTLDPEWVSAQWEVVEYLAPLGWPELKPGPMGHLLVAVALGAKEKGQRAAGVEAFVAGTREGRLEGPGVAGWLVELLAPRYLLMTRVAKALEEAARAGAAEAVRGLLDLVVPGVAPAKIDDVRALLALWLELMVAADAGWDAPAAQVEALEHLGLRGGKLGKVARGALARRRA